MGHQNFGQILGLIFLSYKILQQCAKESKTATQNIFKPPPKNDSDAEQNKTTGMAGSTALIYFSLNCKSTTNIVSDHLPFKRKGEFIHNVRTAWSVGHRSEDNSTGCHRS
jgi:hypothetical protein